MSVQTHSATTDPVRIAPRAGVIGLGMIGGGVAVSLARSGRIPVVYDIRPDAADDLLGVPPVAASPVDVARDSDVVLVAVVDAAQARTVLCADDGVLAGAHPGLVVVLLSTVAVPVVHELARECSAKGVELLDCGVTRGSGCQQRTGRHPRRQRRRRPRGDARAGRLRQGGGALRAPRCGMATKIAGTSSPTAPGAQSTRPQDSSTPPVLHRKG